MDVYDSACPWCLCSAILNGRCSPHYSWEGWSFSFIRFLHTEYKGGEITRQVWNLEGLGCWPCGKLSSWSFAGAAGFWVWEGRGGVDLRGDRGTQLCGMSSSTRLSRSSSGSSHAVPLGWAARPLRGGRRTREEMKEAGSLSTKHRALSAPQLLPR